MPPKTCPKHDETMTRLFTSISSLDNKMTKIETKFGTVEIFAEKADKILFGTEKSDGLLTKVSTILKHLNLQWVLISFIILTIIGAAIAMLFKGA